MSKNLKTRFVKPKTKKGARVLRQREPQQVETLRKILFLYGHHPSQVVKNVLTDLHTLQRRESVRLTRKNEILPFENGGEVALEHFSAKTDCGQFVLASHTKKRPHNLVLGRFFDHRLYDLLELGVESFKSLKAFGAASSAVQVDNKPCIIFCGEQFEHDPEFKQAKSMLLDLFRGRIVDGINLTEEEELAQLCRLLKHALVSTASHVNLQGIDHVIFMTALERKILLRQYAVKLKRSGTKVPRIVLEEMGPSMDLSIRRCRPANLETEKLASQQPRPTKKKEKNVSSSLLEGKVGRIYMPKQQIQSMPQHKLKGLKRSLDSDANDSGPASKAARTEQQPAVLH